METQRGKMEGGEGERGKKERRRRKTSSKHVDATAPRNYRAIYWIRERGCATAAAAAAIRMDGNAVPGLVPGVGPEWFRKLFTKFPDSAGCSVKMQTPRLIPRLIGVCDYCRGELCRRVWRTLFSHEQRVRARIADESRFVDLASSRGYILAVFSSFFFPRGSGARVYALACTFFFRFPMKM